MNKMLELNDSITTDQLNDSITTNHSIYDPFTNSYFGILREGGVVEPCTCLKNRKSVPGIKNVIFNNPATIVFWEDGTKTVVKCMEGYIYDEYTGFMAAVCKKLFGSSSAVRKIVYNHLPCAASEATTHE